MIVFLTATTKIMSSLNISFVKLAEEECEVSELHISHLKKEDMLSEIEHTINRWEKKQESLSKLS